MVLAVQALHWMEPTSTLAELRRAGLDDDELGVTSLEAAVRAAFRPGPRPLLFSFRVRIGVVPAPSDGID